MCWRNILMTINPCKDIKAGIIPLFGRKIRYKEEQMFFLIIVKLNPFCILAASYSNYSFHVTWRHYKTF